MPFVRHGLWKSPNKDIQHERVNEISYCLLLYQYAHRHSQYSGFHIIKYISFILYHKNNCSLKKAMAFFKGSKSFFTIVNTSSASTSK